MWKEQESENNWPSAEQLASFWTHLRGELSFRTVLYYKAAKCHCWIEKLVDENNMTTYATLVWNKESNVPYLKSQQNVDILSLVCLRADLFEPALKTLSVMLNHMREVPLLLQICLNTDWDSSVILGLVEQILKRCQELLMPNVLLLLGDFFSTTVLYGHRIFPTFRLLSRVYRSSLQLYPYKLDNLHGHVIRTRSDLSQPYTIVHKDLNDKLIVTGFLWRLVEVFARQLNATLELSYDPTASKSLKESYSKLLRHIQNGSTDITTSLFPTSFSSRSSLPVFSYPVIINNWCTMLPVERVVSPRQAMAGVMESPWMWLYIGVIYWLIHWLRGRSMPGRSFLTLLPSLIQLTLLCTVVAQLSALFIRPQQQQFISNFEQLNAAGLQIVGLRSEFSQYPEHMRIKYASSFLSYENYTEFLSLRDSLNTSFAYTIYSLKWNTLAVMQKHFKRPLFRYSTEFCIQQVSLNCVIFPENSLYRHKLNLYLILVRQSGILRFWIDKSFYDLLHAGSYKLQDLSTEVAAGPLTYADWVFIVVLYGCAIAVSVIILVFELLVYYINVCLDML